MHTHTHTIRPHCPSLWLREITATWSGTTSIMQRPPKAPQVSFNMSTRSPPPPRLSMWPFIWLQWRTSKQNTSPGGKPSQLTMQFELLCREDTAWCFQRCDNTIRLLNVALTLYILSWFCRKGPCCSSQNTNPFSIHAAPLLPSFCLLLLYMLHRLNPALF